jgi:Tol biopolymer transport system component
VRALLVALASFVVLASSAGAAAPASRNGLVAFARCCAPAGIFAIRADGADQRLLYRAAHDDAPLQPSWAPNGRQIAFSPGPPHSGIWIMGANGASRHRITVGRGNSLSPDWSPAGKWLVFADLASPRGQLHDLYRVRANGRDLKRLTTKSVDEISPAWSPAAAVIVYARGRDLWRMGPDGSGQRLLARNGAAPAWSADATRIAFIRAGDPWVMSKDGTRARRVAHMSAQQGEVAWSPDGRWLVTAPVDRGDLLLVRVDGSQTQALTHASGFFHSRPTWQRLAD